MGMRWPAASQSFELFALSRTQRRQAASSTSARWFQGEGFRDANGCDDETAHLPRLQRDHARRPGGRGRDRAFPAHAFRQSFVVARLWQAGARGGRARTGARCDIDWRIGVRDRVHRLRDRGEQPRHFRGREGVANQAEAHRYLRHRTSGCDAARACVSRTRVGMSRSCRWTAMRRVHLGALASALRDDTALVSIMHANNEVGTVQDVAENREYRSCARSHRAHRRRTVGRKAARRRRHPRRRLAHDRRAQVLRDQGDRRTLRSTRNASHARDRRGRARTRTATGHRERAGDRRPGRGSKACARAPAGDPDGRCAGCATCCIDCSRTAFGD